jgi:trimethylamine:corrinoid methyltransferase-like protein
VDKPNQELPLDRPPQPPPLRFTRSPLISPDQSARIHDLAKQVLSQIGLEVRHPPYQAQLQKAGLKIAGDRLLIPPQVVDEYVDEMRRQVSRPRREDPPPDSGRLTLGVSSYSLFVHDIELDRVVPYTTERLVEMTRLVDSLADDGVSGAPPGIPMDVPPDLQPIAQYRIAALYARQGATPVDPTSAHTARYLFDMADVMGSPIHHLPVYIPTPLRLGGESLDVVMSCLDRLEHISVSSMPSAGTSAPLHPFGALALAAAEVIGGMIAVKILTGKPVTFSANIFPSDLREGSMVFGSPENMLFQMLGADFNRFYGYQWNGAPDNIHVMAKVPDCQSAAEKAAIMTAGAFLGARHFSCAGTLSLDEIFSPEQLLADCETRDWVQRGLQGIWLGEEVADDWLEEIRQGIAHGFMGLDSTLDHYKAQVWYPQRFLRGAIGPWLSQDQPRLSGKLRHEVRRRIASHSFELDLARRNAIEEIYRAASGT